MTEDQIRLLSDIFSNKPTTPAPSISEVPVVGRTILEQKMQDTLRERENARQLALEKEFAARPISEKLSGAAESAKFIGSTVARSVGQPFAELYGRATDQPGLGKTLAEGAKLPESDLGLEYTIRFGDAMEPVAKAMEASKIPDITPGMLTAPVRAIDEAAAQAARAGQQVARQATQRLSRMPVQADLIPLFANRIEDAAPPQPKVAKAPVIPAVPEIQFPAKSDIGFYSPTEQAVLNLKQDKGTGDQFLAQIQKTAGVKPDEIKWTGLDDFLKGKKSVTKTEIQDYLQANRVDVQEVRLGGQQDFDLTRLSQLEDEFAMLRQHPIDDPNFGEDKYDEMIRLMNIRDQSTTSDLYRQADDAMMYGQRAQARGDQRSAENFYRQYGLLNTRAEKLDLQGLGMTNLPKFSQHKLPGGENYREILLTLPEKLVSKEEISKRMFGKPYNELTDQERVQVTPEFQKTMGQDYRASHFDQPNVLAHMRVNDRTVDGKKTLFIEEIQSDWHQAGRKKGYQSKDINSQLKVLEKSTEKRYLEIRGLSNRMAALDDSQLDEFNVLDVERQRLQDLQGEETDLGNRLYDVRREGVPDAPFKTTWHELTLKRAIQEASEKGYDQIAFTTGKTQAERYDLSKQIKTLIYSEPDAQGLRKVEAITPNGDRLLGKRYTPKEIEDNVGKEVAEKISKSTGDFDQRTGTHAMSGLDLQVGGEGMKGFYDNILPKSLDKLGKKFDAKVGKTQMDGVEVWQMDITPKMRETVKSQGVPMFAKGGAVKAAVRAAEKAKEGQKMLQGVYRGYTGDRLDEPVLSTTPQRRVAEYYANRRSEERGEDPHVEMLMVDPSVGKDYGLSIPIDRFNRDIVTTRAKALAPEDVVERTQLKKSGGQVSSEMDLLVPLFQKGGSVMRGVRQASKKAAEAQQLKKGKKLVDLLKSLKEEGNLAAIQRLERIGDEAPYAAERINADALRSAISRGDNANLLAIIKPEDFRYLAEQLDENYLTLQNAPKILAPTGMSVREYIKDLENIANIQGFDDIPFLDYGEHGGTSRLGVKGHEGRHRMRALEGLGDEAALVRLLPRASVREPLPRRSRPEFLEALTEKYGTPLQLDPEGFESVNVDLSKPVLPFQKGGSAIKGGLAALS